MNNKLYYEKLIYDRFSDLIKSGKNIDNLDNYDLSKIFEYYTAIKLTDEYKKEFLIYEDIDADFKEDNNMSQNDTGIDISDKIDTIVQCKLRSNNLTLKECSTFMASQNIFSNDENKIIVRWPNMILARNDDCIISNELNKKISKKLLTDKKYSRPELIQYCNELYNNPPKIDIPDNKITLRDYQIECINIIKNNNKNIIICLPTGTGKNVVIINSIENDKKYLILVPRIILMEQLKDEIIKNKPSLKNTIQTIGDGNNTFKNDKNITISVYNSVSIIEQHASQFHKIFIDEAHNIKEPSLYNPYDDGDNEYNDDEKKVDNSDIDDYDEDYEDNEIEEEYEDDAEDEVKQSKYMKIITDLTKYNNNVYLSATIDKIDRFEYYKKDIRDMITLGYLCDYNINIPIFTEDPTNRNICSYLISNYRNTIIYCHSQTEGIKINKIMNDVMPNCSKYIDCNTKKSDRKNIIKEYKNGNIPFLVNVRVLTEGFDAPITRAVCFLHLPSNQTQVIQIIGRCLRLHPNKINANVILPGSSNEDCNGIARFLNIVSKNDSRIRKSYMNKKLSGYISINKDDDEDDENIQESISYKYDMIYNSIGVLTNNIEIWFNYLERVKKFIDENNRRPSEVGKTNDEKKLGKWVTRQLTQHKRCQYNMKNDKIYNMWNEFINDEKYKEYFMSNEEKWINILEKVKKYMDENNKRPHRKSENFLNRWIDIQIQNFKNQKNIMTNINIYNKWNELINDEKYREYFMSNEEIWTNTLEEIKQFINDNERKPLYNNEYEKRLINWINTQTQTSKNRTKIMKEDDIYNKWNEFINDDKYREYFISNEENWYNNLEEVKKYIDKNNKRPSDSSKNKDEKELGKWLSHQKTNSDKRTKIMKNDEIYNKWNEFINDEKYKEYFMSNEEKWINILEKVKKFIDEHKKRPSSESKNKDEKSLGNWLQYQITNSKKRKDIMKDDEIYNKLLIYLSNKKPYLGFKDDYMNFITEKIPEILKYLCKERKINYNEEDDNTILKNKLINYASSANPLNDDELEFINSI
jgi:superfamily II DNA or RNA helicase